MATRTTGWTQFLPVVALLLVSSTSLMGQEPRLVGVSRIDELPPLPPQVKADLDV